jgi:Tfp pilus assembly protein PilF
MKLSPNFRLVLALGLIATIFVGCSRDPNVRKQKYYESAQRYAEKGQYREAAVQYKNAIQIDSTYGNAHYGLAQSFLKLQQWNCSPTIIPRASTWRIC